MSPRLLIRMTLHALCLGSLFTIHLDNAYSKTIKRTTALVPFQPLKNHGVPLIKVRINGTYDATFMVDTGFSECVMTQKLVNELGLHTGPAYIDGILPIAFGTEQNEMTFVKSMEFGSLTVTDTRFIVVKTDELLKFPEENIDGVIGGSLLSQFALFVDFPRHTMAFITPGGLSSDEVANLQFGKTKPIHLDQQKYKIDLMVAPPRSLHEGDKSNKKVDPSEMVHIPLGDVRATVYRVKVDFQTGSAHGSEMMFVDTGSFGTNLSRDLAQRLKLVPIDNGTGSTMYNGSDFSDVAYVQSMKIGNLTLPHVKISYPGNQNSNIPLLLGENIFSNCSVLFDFPKHALYMKPLLPPLDGHPDTSITADTVDRKRLCNAVRMDWFPSSLDDSNADRMAKIASLQAAMTGTGDDIDRYWMLAHLYRDEHLEEQSQAAFDKVVELQRAVVARSPLDSVELARLGRDLAEDGKLDEAIQMARNATAAAPQSVLCWIALGRVLHQQSLMTFSKRLFPVDISDGLTEYQDFITRLRAQVPSADTIALAQKQSQEARSAFDKAILLGPKDPVTYQARADFLEADMLGLKAPVKELQGNPVELKREMHSGLYIVDEDQVANLSPDDIDIQAEVADLDVVSAVESGVAGLDLREEKFWTSLPQSVRDAVQLKINRLTALSVNTKDLKAAAQAQAALGELQYEAMRDLPTAEATLSAVLVHDPSRRDALQTLAFMLSDKLRYDDLMPLINAQLTANDSTQAHLLLARTMIKMDYWDQAATQFQMALKLSPDRFETNLASAACFLHQSGGDSSRLGAAKACLDKAKIAMGNHPGRERRANYGILMAIYLGLSGNPNTAKSMVLAILEDDSTNTQARDVLAALVLKGD